MFIAIFLSFWGLIIGYGIFQFLFERISADRAAKEIFEHFDLAEEKQGQATIISRLQPLRISSSSTQNQTSEFYFERRGINAKLSQCHGCQTGYQTIRRGPYGKFIGCSRFPKCEWHQTLKEFNELYKTNVNSEMLDEVRHAYQI